MIDSPLPANELQRLTDLVDMDLDYSDLQSNLSDLAKLAAKIAGTEISLVNLIDSYTQWSVSGFGFQPEHMPREDSVCQYTIMGNDEFEIKDLSQDTRFHNKEYVTGDPRLRYYLGLPLKTKNGTNIGVLCVVDKEEKVVDPEKIELLKIVAKEIVRRLKSVKVVQGLHQKLRDLKETQKKVAHDIRGPLGGIVGLSQIITEQGESTSIGEIMEAFNLITKSGNSILELADEILTSDDIKERSESPLMDYEITLYTFKEKLEKLYRPQAVNKNIEFTVLTNSHTERVPFSKNKLLQIAGNLISNSMKFTPANGKISVLLDLKVNPTRLTIHVTDSGIGITQEKIDLILAGNTKSTEGTEGEKGYGFGLALVKHLIDSLGGRLEIQSNPNSGSTFIVSIPQK
jgi:signal transduction histidine kinase